MCIRTYASNSFYFPVSILRMSNGVRAAYLRNFIFGVEDSLVSTVGLLSGVTIAGLVSKDILVTGVVLIFVEAISMTAGSFLSESSAEEYEKRGQTFTSRSYVASLIMFVSYFASGFIPLAPYLLFMPLTALPISIGVSVCALACLGVVGALLARANVLVMVVRTVLVGGLAILVGALVGAWVG